MIPALHFISTKHAFETIFIKHEYFRAVLLKIPLRLKYFAHNIFFLFVEIYSIWSDRNFKNYIRMGIFILFYLHKIFYLSVHNNENNHTHILNNKNWILKVIVRTRQIASYFLFAPSGYNSLKILINYIISL